MHGRLHLAFPHPEATALVRRVRPRIAIADDRTKRSRRGAGRCVLNSKLNLAVRRAHEQEMLRALHMQPAHERSQLRRAAGARNAARSGLRRVSSRSVELGGDSEEYC